jgi:DNA polymerase-4
MIACISIPYFAAAIERRADKTLARKPLAIGGRPWEAKPVYAFSREVARNGVQSGMSLRLVQVLSPQSHFMPAAEDKYYQVSGEVIDVLTDFSCLVEPQELWHSSATPRPYLIKSGRTLPARYCLDLEGLPVKESITFVKEMGKIMRRQTRLAPAIGLATDKFTAQIAASICRVNHALPVSPGHNAQFLSTRTISFLPLDKETSRRLHLLGVRTLGQLADLPSSSMKSQFGPDIEPFYRLAQGRVDEPVQPYPFERQEEAGHQFDAPIIDIQVITAVLHRLSAQLAQRLQTTGWEGRELHLHLEMDDDASQQHVLTFRYPTANVDRLSAALEELCAQASFTCGIIGLSVKIAGLRPAAVQQLALFEETTDSHKVSHTIQNLIAKYKACRFLGPMLTERNHPLPERRFRLQTIPQVNYRTNALL